MRIYESWRFLRSVHITLRKQIRQTNRNQMMLKFISHKRSKKVIYTISVNEAETSNEYARTETKRILFPLCYVNENHQMIINDLLYKGQKVIERVYVTGGITLKAFSMIHSSLYIIFFLYDFLKLQLFLI